MPAAVRLGDICTGHGCFPSRPNIGASPDTFTENLGSHRVSDPWASHCCGPPCHGGSQASGSPNVFVNELAFARIGDSISCGSANATGAITVFINE
jgi:uncharacterized Zn-binding protein involved in type VI secretion